MIPGVCTPVGLGGWVRVDVSQYAMSRRWVFPKHPFFEYEAKDEEWCRKLGIGHEEWAPAAYWFGDRIVMHPDVYKELERKFATSVGPAGRFVLIP